MSRDKDDQMEIDGEFGATPRFKEVQAKRELQRSEAEQKELPKLCPTCQGWLWNTLSMSHRCPPRWECRAEGETDPRTIFAIDAEEAAEKFTEDYENSYAEYPIAGGKETLTVFVRSAPVYVDPTAPVAPEAKYIVEGETVPQYNARFVEAK
jgi:hypothetical protein